MQKLFESMSFDTTPEYLEEVRKEREEGEAEIQRMQAAQAFQESPCNALQTTWGTADNSKIGQKFGQSQRKKVKTTGTNTMGSLGISALSLDQGKVCQGSNESTAATEIPVRQDSLNLFRKMFSSSTDSTSGSVKWTHLVQALTDAGLVAAQAPGSAVTFSNGSAGAINFHKPHEPVVDAMMLRCMGRRLRKWFGWTGDRFVLRAKEGGM